MISFALDEEQQLVQETLRKFAAEELRPRMRELEREGGVPEPLQRRFHELGLGLLDAPEALGGQGASAVTLAIVHEELAFGDPGAAVALSAPHLGAQAILALGDQAQQRRWLPRFAASDGWSRRGALAYAERSGPPTGFATRARRQGSHYVLEGHKAFVVHGGSAELTVVFAQVDGADWNGVGAFVVERGTPGLRAGARHQLLGLETVEASELRLEGCSIPADQRLAGGADFHRGVRTLFARAALLNAARQVGLARASYENALAYTQDRKAFGKPVAHFQAIAFTLADMLMDVESARWMVWRAAAALDRGELRVAAATAHANEAAWRVADNGVQLLGGAGFVKDYPAEKWLRDTKTLALFGPPTECAQLAVASGELGHALEAGLPSPCLQPFFT